MKLLYTFQLRQLNVVNLRVFFPTKRATPLQVDMKHTGIGMCISQKLFLKILNRILVETCYDVVLFIVNICINICFSEHILLVCYDCILILIRVHYFDIDNLGRGVLTPERK